MPSVYIRKGYRTTEEIVRERRDMLMRADKKMQALAMIDGAVAKRLLAEQLQQEAERDMAEARAILDEIKEAEADAAG